MIYGDKNLKMAAAMAALVLGLSACETYGDGDKAAEVAPETSDAATMAADTADSASEEAMAAKDDAMATAMDGEGMASADDMATEDGAMAFGNGPAMWRMRDADSEIYLFGTFHILPAGLEWVTADFSGAMVQTETTWTEADTESPEAMQALQAAVAQYGLNPPGVTLSSTLGEERATEFAAVAEQYGLPMSQLEPFRPWLAVITLTQLAFQKAGYDPTKGADALVTAQAVSEGDEIRHFETAVEQIKAIASLEETDDFTMTDDSLDMLADFQDFADQMSSLWATGDVEGLEKEIIIPTREQSERAFDIIFKQRNANWVETIAEMMAGSGDIFIAVGAGHLVGEDSVVDMLEERGYTVERVQ